MVFEQRAYPNNFIPQNAYANAMIQRDILRQQNSDKMPAINWVSLGPTPGYYFSYGNISSRIVTGAFHPTNPSIIYVGPANGGVWKSTDSGVNWTPLTDNQPSMSMGAIAIDPTNPNVIYAGTGEATYSGASYYGRGLLNLLMLVQPGSISQMDCPRHLISQELKFVRIIQMNFLLHLVMEFTQKYKFWFKLGLRWSAADAMMWFSHLPVIPRLRLDRELV